MPRTFAQRVSYAAKIIRERRPASRRFCGCFEEGDGDAVVNALVALANRRPGGNLSRNLSHYIATEYLGALTA